MVDLIQNTQILCKVYCLDKPGPFKLCYDLKNQKVCDVRVLTSEKVQEPNDANRQLVFQNQKCMVIEPQGLIVVQKNKNEVTRFKSEYVYLSFFSQTGCTISVTVKFSKDEEEEVKVKKFNQVGNIDQRRLKSQIQEKIEMKVN
mmetsp:Transcript_2187/g.2117  ORF Transcript_2187/g.2117 Transcript_2187/m.2117 type:complete len:144 (+) Transcript_2187:1112-1543(+)